MVLGGFRSFHVLVTTIWDYHKCQSWCFKIVSNFIAYVRIRITYLGCTDWASPDCPHALGFHLKTPRKLPSTTYRRKDETGLLQLVCARPSVREVPSPISVPLIPVNRWRERGGGGKTERTVGLRFVSQMTILNYRRKIRTLYLLLPLDL